MSAERRDSIRRRSRSESVSTIIAFVETEAEKRASRSGLAKLVAEIRAED